MLVMLSVSSHLPSIQWIGRTGGTPRLEMTIWMAAQIKLIAAVARQY